MMPSWPSQPVRWPAGLGWGSLHRRRRADVANDSPKGASATLRDIQRRYARLSLTQADREATGVTGLSAELLTYHAERKLIHQMLSSAGIPEVSSGEGERI